MDDLQPSRPSQNTVRNRTYEFIYTRYSCCISPRHPI